MSRNNLNQGDTVVVIPLTTKFPRIKKADGSIAPKYDNHFILYKKDYSFLREDSCIKFEDIRSIDKIRIGERLGNIKPVHLKMLKKSILFAYGFK